MPALRVLLRRRADRGKEIADRLPERWGVDATKRPAGKLLWLHAASVGETVSILPVLAALPPEVTVLLTTGTVTSATLLAQRLPALELADRVIHRFAPLDVPGWATRFLDHWRPDAAAFVESELWPNQIRAAADRGIPLLLLNGRLSPRSAAGWARVPGFARSILGRFSAVRARGEEDAARFRALGAPNVSAPGDLKLAAPPLPADPTALAAMRAAFQERPTWLAASTHPGEEALIAAVHRQLAAAHPELITIVAPRHPERGPALAAELGAPLRSAGAPPAPGLWIADTLGELGLWYRLAPVTFVGRSLLPPGGGQNPLEPARLGCAIAVGPHTGNFAAHVAALREAGALTVVADPAALAGWAESMLADPTRRTRAGAAAARVADQHADLPRETAAALVALLHGEAATVGQPAAASTPGRRDGP
ncbi:MAG: 3-deoxy-D-manno-octulosonic acid transferase [Rhodospirillales bacterium]|nr:3-deoxy-D-manno-octulosonic acid transferase [Rhodospirillales bacterium]